MQSKDPRRALQGNEMTLHDRLATIETQRAQSDPLPQGIAPPISSDAFRSRREYDTPEHPRAWDKKLSQESGMRFASSLKAHAHVAESSPVISLGTARPASMYSPWDSVTVLAQDHRRVVSATFDGPLAEIKCVRGEESLDLGSIMNYGLRRWLTSAASFRHRARRIGPRPSVPTVGDESDLWEHIRHRHHLAHALQPR